MGCTGRGCDGGGGGCRCRCHCSCCCCSRGASCWRKHRRACSGCCASKSSRYFWRSTRKRAACCAPHRGKFQGRRARPSARDRRRRGWPCGSGRGARREEWDPGLLLKPRRSLIIPKALQVLVIKRTSSPRRKPDGSTSASSPPRPADVATLGWMAAFPFDPCPTWCGARAIAGRRVVGVPDLEGGRTRGDGRANTANDSICSARVRARDLMCV